MAANVLFKTATRAQYNGLTKDAGTFYRVTNEDSSVDVYLGTLKLDNVEDIEAAIAALDTTENVVLATESNGVVTLTKAINEENGIIASVSGTGATITLTKVATTGKAEDITIDDTAGNYESDDLEAVLGEIAEMIDEGGTGSKVYMKDEAGAASSQILRTYKIYQGVDPDDESASAEDLEGGLVGTINIPKDFLVKSAKITNVTKTGDDYVDGDGAVIDDESVDHAGQYIKFVINTKDGDDAANNTVIYVATDGLIRDLNTEITNVTKDGKAITIKTSIVQTEGKIFNGASDLTLADVASTGEAEDVKISTSSKVYDATDVKNVDQAIDALYDKVEADIAALDTTSDLTIASKSAQDIITITADIAEQDGIIKKGEGTDIQLAKVAATGASGDVSYDNTTSGLSATDVKAALDEVVGTTVAEADKDDKSITGAKKYADNAVETALTWTSVE